LFSSSLLPAWRRALNMISQWGYENLSLVKRSWFDPVLASRQLYSELDRKRLPGLGHGFGPGDLLVLFPRYDMHDMKWVLASIYFWAHWQFPSILFSLLFGLLFLRITSGGFAQCPIPRIAVRSLQSF
jgi:hypothetical protein